MQALLERQDVFNISDKESYRNYKTVLDSVLDMTNTQDFDVDNYGNLIFMENEQYYNIFPEIIANIEANKKVEI